MQWDEYFLNFFLHNEEKIEWFWLSANENITMRIIEENPDLNWNWGGISRNPNLTLEMLEKYPDKQWDWMYMSWNPNLSLEIFEKYSDYLDAWQNISKSIKLTQSFIDEYECSIFWDCLSQNTSLTIDMIKSNPDKAWDWTEISRNKAMTLDIIEQNLDMEWIWEYVSGNPNLTLEFIEKHKDKHWDWGLGGISNLPNLTLEFIEKHKDKDWDWWGIANYINITDVSVVNHIVNRDKSLWQGISYNETLTMEIIKIYLDNLGLDWSPISNNPNLSFEFIMKYKKFMNWVNLACNSFKYEKELFEKKVKSANLIKKCWKKASSDPNHIFAKNIIERGFK